MPVTLFKISRYNVFRDWMEFGGAFFDVESVLTMKLDLKRDTFWRRLFYEFSKVYTNFLTSKFDWKF